jgi:hypothetical protein
MDASPTANVSMMNVAGAALMVAENKKTKDDVEKTLAKTIWGESSNTVLLEGIVDAAKKLEKSPSPRRAMVIINLDGLAEGSSVPPAKVMQQVIASGASVWIAKAGPQGPQRELFLSRAPQGTGGVRLKSDDEKVLENVLIQLAKAMASQYEVTYTRPDGPMPKQLQMAQVRGGVNLLYPQTPPK